MECKYEAIVAGAGIWGCTVARRLADAGKRVLVLEKRSVIGGNCACEIDAETGIEIHTYGSHIFHTSNEDVWKFLNRFTSFNNYHHMVLANYRGKIYHLPIGRTLYQEFGTDDKQAIFDAFIKGYTAKQWGMPAEKVDPAIIARLKVRDNFSTDYFDDPYHGIPSEGYNKMFERMLEHENIEVRCGAGFGLSTNCTDLHELKDGGKIYYSGPIDALFDYKFGALPWRTLRFELEKLGMADYQHNTVVNYTEYEVPYTRIHEFKHYHPEWMNSLNSCNSRTNKTIIMREYPKTWQLGDEPYYPIDNEESRALVAKYQAEVEEFNHHNASCFMHHASCSLVVGGRLGGYKYYDMDKSVAAALEVEI